jgi:hypothetical protein
MKGFFLLIFLMVVIKPAPSGAEDFLGAPVIPGGKTILKSESRLEMVAKLSHEEAMKFYTEALKGYKDIKFRDWKDATYIEDDGKLPWHSITISKKDTEGTAITIAKDNWTWIMGTLLLRYIGVFVVLLFLLLGLSISGAVISKTIKKMEAKKPNSNPP